MIEGENYTALHGKNVEIGKVIVYNNIMEYHVEAGFLRGRTVRAIYKLEGETLTICFNLADNSDVPSDFTTKNNSQLLLVRFVRES